MEYIRVEFGFEARKEMGGGCVSQRGNARGGDRSVQEKEHLPSEEVANDRVAGCGDGCGRIMLVDTANFLAFVRLEM